MIRRIHEEEASETLFRRQVTEEGLANPRPCSRAELLHATKAIMEDLGEARNYFPSRCCSSFSHRYKSLKRQLTSHHPYPCLLTTTFKDHRPSLSGII